MSEFTLRIKMGNEAIRDREDVANALNIVAVGVEYLDRGSILDMNGNKVGEWGFTK